MEMPYLKFHINNTTTGNCCSLRSASDAQKTCSSIYGLQHQIKY